ncbi:MAG: hypothetical protein K6E49_02085 [Lachnospiraceae bacterium]|nr:hypothetical protein [Lachnospiraceae bacterium]
MKKIKAVLICLIGVMLLAGCGGSNSADIDLKDKLKNVSAGSEESDTGDEKQDEEKSEKKKKKKKSSGDDTKDASDEIDYEALYAPVFDEVFEVLDYGFNIDKEYDYVSGGLSEKVMYSQDDDLLNSIGYLITDMSGDGIPELLIGSDENYNDETNSYIYTLCSIIDEKPECIIAGSTRSSYNYMGDDHFYYEGSGGASITIFGKNHLSRDGSEIVWDDFYFTDEKEDGEIGIYHNNTGIFSGDESEELNISEKEFSGKMNEYRDRCVTIKWTPIGQYRDGVSGNAGQTQDWVTISDGDPLEGLVASDILEKFRSSNPVGNSDSIKDEANALGSWVQNNIGKIPKDIKDKGEKIGNSYEFWFGTDISNNFDDNFPRIYETYFCLKDYYMSDGDRNRDYYESISEENDFLGTGDPEKIEMMYKDMQEFITDCNNIIRKQ